MKKIVFVIVALFLSCSLLGQHLQWAKAIRNTISWSEGNGIAQDAFGNVYSVGTFIGTIDLDPGANTYNINSIGEISIYICKLDADGNFIWGKVIEGSMSQIYSSAIAVDAIGNVYITGYYKQNIDFDPGLGVFNINSNGYPNAYITKLDANGNFIWAKKIGDSETYGLSIAVDLSGNVFTTGWFSGSPDFDPSTNTYNLSSSSTSDYDIFVLKLDANGNFMWAKKIGSSNTDEGRAIATDNAGNILIAGRFNGTVDFDPSSTVTYNLTSLIYDAFILKLDVNGNFIWAKKIGGSGFDNIYGITLDVSGNVYTTGTFTGVADFDPSSVVHNLNSAGQDDIFVSKLDILGNFVWAKSMGSYDQDFAYSIALDLLGNVYTTGQFPRVADFDPSSSVYNLTPSSLGANNMFVSKLDNSGNFVWARNMGGNSSSLCSARSLCVDATENVYCTGKFAGTVDFDPNLNTYNLVASTSSNSFIVKLGNTITPIRLLNFKILKDKKNAYLSWQTVTEINTDKFEIEKSTDGVSFIKSAEVKAANNSDIIKNYEFVDFNAGLTFSENTIYYRFKQLDLDGKFTYSNILSTKFGKTNSDLIVYPNPTSNLLTLQGNGIKDREMYHIFDQLGKEVQTDYLNNNTISVKSLLSGIYFLQIDKKIIQIIKK